MQKTNELMNEHGNVPSHNRYCFAWQFFINVFNQNKHNLTKPNLTYPSLKVSKQNNFQKNTIDKNLSIRKTVWLRSASK